MDATVIDVRRLGGVLSATAFVSLCLAFCEGVLGASTPWWPTWLKNDWAAVEFPAYKAIGAQISGLVKEGYADGRPIGLLIGASQQFYGIDMPRLEADVEPRLKWLRLTVYAGSPYELEQIGRLLIEQRIRPSLVLVNIGLRMLARSETYRKFDTTDYVKIDRQKVVDDLRAMRLFALEKSMETLIGNAFNTIIPDRMKINYRMNDGLIRLRKAVLERFGLGIIAVFPSADQPWFETGPDLPPWSPQELPGKISGALRIYREEGRFDPDLYSPGSIASRSLVELVRQMRSTRAEVVVVIMPERSPLRDPIPAEARRTFFKSLEESFGAEAPPVIDLESFIPDEHMIDQSHVDDWGKAAVTRRLIAELNGL